MVTKKRTKKKRTSKRPVGRRTKGTRKKTSSGLPSVPTKRGVDFKDYIHLFFGQPGVGKTTFVNSLRDDILFLSTDRGTRFLETMAVECNHWRDFEKALIALEKLHEKGGKMPYSAVAIDHIADWASQGESAILEELQIKALTDAGYGKGWSMYKKLLERFVQRLRALDLGIIFIAHEEIRTTKVRGIDVDKCQPKMSKQAWDVVIPLCDLVGYCEMRRVKKGKKAVQIRTLTTSLRDELYVKDRTNRSQPEARDYIELDAQKFMSSFK